MTFEVMSQQCDECLFNRGQAMTTRYVLKLLGFADGKPAEHVGWYLKSADIEAHDGQGHVVFTPFPNRALQFATQADALLFWQAQSKTHPIRPDGKPNRPLTAGTMEIEPFDTSALQ